jgi:hypothetical protein
MVERIDDMPDIRGGLESLLAALGATRAEHKNGDELKKSSEHSHSLYNLIV